MRECVCECVRVYVGELKIQFIETNMQEVCQK